ncbi:MAG: radical SAM protein [Phycisphaerae bacterium]|nr:radical SAM protein [Phycisphaerae bacterium]
MRPRILLVNPPIYDFSAYDFWLKPLGLLGVAGPLSPHADVTLFDYLDRLHPAAATVKPSADRWGRGHFLSQKMPRPPQFAHIPRIWRRFGLPRPMFEDFLRANPPFDVALIQTVMTYWYPGVAEVIEDLRRRNPNTQIVLGGFYAQACPEHAGSLGADLVVSAPDPAPLYDTLRIYPDQTVYHPPLWSAYDRLETAAMKLTVGCPLKCTYCWAGQHGPPFVARPLEHCIADLDLLLARGVRDIAFYDDALLCRPDEVFVPFLRHVIDSGLRVNFHTPNALHARYITPEIAGLMVAAGFKTFYIGFESTSEDFHKKTGAKVVSRQLESAVRSLLDAGAHRRGITAYLILGHPRSDLDQLVESMHYVNKLGICIALSDFSPIPGTPDGEACRRWVDLDEPLNHNKTAFPTAFLGFERSNQIKDLGRQLNRSVKTASDPG